MNAKDICFSEKDVTTLYDALNHCSGSDIACALLRPNRSLQGLHVQDEGPAVRLASRRASSMLSALRSLEPNFEASSEIILPWKASHLVLLSGMSWPNALGMRIAFPANASSELRNRLLADVLLGMSCIQDEPS